MLVMDEFLRIHNTMIKSNASWFNLHLKFNLIKSELKKFKIIYLILNNIYSISFLLLLFR